MISGRRRSVIFFTVLGICLVVLAVTLNISWVVLNWGRALLLVLGIVLFIPIIAGMVLNTIFLVREIRRNEQHDSFINAVTHELKTPVASIRLYLQTLQTRELDEDKRREFYRIMLEDSDRLLQTIEQVLQAGSSGSRWRRISRTRLDLGTLSKECVELARCRKSSASPLATAWWWGTRMSSRRRSGISSTTGSSTRRERSGCGSCSRRPRVAAWR
jgi:two-component system, OmpR family, sensor histidine kinase SenX3